MSDEHLWVTGTETTNLDEVRGCIVPEYLRANIGKWGWGDAIAYESAETGRKYTHNQVLQNSRTFAAGLLKLRRELVSLQQQDVVAVMLPNVPEYPSIIFGIWEAGFVATLVNPAYIEREIRNQLEVSRAKVTVTLAQFLPVVRSIQKENPGILKIILLGAVTDTDADGTYENCLNYSDLLQTDTDSVDFFTGSQVTPGENDVALLPFSSGTTGLPKGVMLTHFALLAAIHVSTPVQKSVWKSAQCVNGDIQSQERLIAILPFFHIFGFQTAVTNCMTTGSHAMTMTFFNPALFIQKLRQFKPTILFLVPTLISFICNFESIGPAELDQVHYVLSGGAAASEALVKRLRSKDKARNATVLEGYGLTETAACLTLHRPHCVKIGSVGRPFSQVWVKVVDIQTGESLGPGPGKRGELCVRSPSNMKGYLNNEQATKECIDNDGWLHTGDIAYYDEDGDFFLVDRIKELIKVKGFQVAPSELEEVIRSHESVGDVAVVGVPATDPNDALGEVPRAFVVLKKGHNVTETDIIEFMKDKVSRYKQLVGGVEFVTDIPKGGSGKILRRVLKEKYCTQQKNH